MTILQLARFAPYLIAAILYALAYTAGIPAMLAGAALAFLGALYGVDRFTHKLIEEAEHAKQ